MIWEYFLNLTTSCLKSSKTRVRISISLGCISFELSVISTPSSVFSSFHLRINNHLQTSEPRCLSDFPAPISDTSPLVPNFFGYVPLGTDWRGKKKLTVKIGGTGSFLDTMGVDGIQCGDKEKVTSEQKSSKIVS